MHVYICVYGCVYYTKIQWAYDRYEDIYIQECYIWCIYLMSLIIPIVYLFCNI